jgi:hypothetical protein
LKSFGLNSATFPYFASFRGFRRSVFARYWASTEPDPGFMQTYIAEPHLFLASHTEELALKASHLSFIA